MGLINTVGNLANQAFNLDTLGGDFLNSVKQQILGIKPENKDSKDKNNYSQYQSNTNSYFADLRGTTSVYRGPTNTYYTENRKKSFNQLFHMDRDFCWTEHAYDTSFKDFEPQVQKIKIVEFQPFEQSFLGQAFYTLSNLKKGKVDVKSNAIGFAGAVGSAMANTPVIGQVGKILKNNMLNNYSKNPQLLYKDDGIDLAVKDPFDAVSRMFIDGIWLHTYVIPLLNGNKNYTYLHKSGLQFDGLAGGGGEFAGLAKAIGGKEADKFKGMDNLWKNIPSTPNFKAALQARPGVSTTFYLINKTSQDLVKNYRFLMAFAAGTYNVQLEWGAMQSPNVYYVQIMGKREMIWAQMQVEVNEIGKYRCDEYAFKKIAKQAGNETNHLFNKANPKYKNVLWPEAWQVSVNISDFTPNTFNTMQHYLRHGSYLSSLMGKTRNYNEAFKKAEQKKKESQAGNSKANKK